MSSNQQFHGSDIERVCAHYGLDQNKIINFSGNVNPLGLAPKIEEELSKHIHLIASYPDRDYNQLRTTLGSYIGVKKEDIIVGNGSTELISLFIKVIEPSSALIIGPTYSEYEREVFINGGRAKYYPLPDEQEFRLDVADLKTHLDGSVDLLVICNPNNPTSSVIDHRALRQILDHCLEMAIDVLIDETYVEFAQDVDNVSAASLTPFYSNLFIIRGVSKFFAAPGLRLGYGVSGNKSLLHQINSLKNPWTINSLAAYAGELMVMDTAYIDRTRKLIDDERNRLTQIMNSWGTVKVYPAHGNFILIKILGETTSHEVFESLIRQHLMIRDAASFPFLSDKHLRFCILCPEDNDLLMKAMKDAIDR